MRVAGQVRPRVGVVLLAVLAAVVGGCGSSSELTDGPGEPPGQSAGNPAIRVIQHQEPRRDFVGPRPARFRWSAIDGADRYAIGLWNEADRMLWRRDDVSGLAAFVVE